ncbi:MAG: methyltransferase family protein [Gemmatimonadaceae bacterium]
MRRPPDLFWRAVAAFLVLPAVVAFLAPWLLAPGGVRFNPVVIPLAIAGIAMLASCVRDFYVAGRGTLAPWAPPTHLVTVGLYRIVRNPMYVAVLIILSAWAVGFGSRTLWIYATCVAVAFHVRVVTYEEPWLARTFGADWLAYRGLVPRWGVSSLLLAGVAYVVVGIGAAALAGAASSPSAVTAWRLAAWLLSLAIFAIHLIVERRRSGRRRSVAIRVALAVALGAIVLAALGPVRKHFGEPHPLNLIMLSLVAWPVITGVPAFVAAFLIGVVLDRGASRTPRSR